MSDTIVDGNGLHVLLGSDARGPYVVVDYDSDYEKIEQLVHSIFSVSPTNPAWL